MWRPGDSNWCDHRGFEKIAVSKADIPRRRPSPAASWAAALLLFTPVPMSLEKAPAAVLCLPTVST
ncbi:unnamed protein product, partial [Ixodes pacificus]